MDLLEVKLRLKLHRSPLENAEIPQWWGRAAHSLLLRTLREYDPALATSLNDDNQIRPFTTSNLVGAHPHGKLKPDEEYSLRFTALNAAVSSLLKQACTDGPLSAGKLVELDEIPFEICEHPHLESNDYAGLSAGFLLASQQPPRRFGLRLLSPTTFKSNGKHLPFPLPELTFGSLMERWNAFAPVTFPTELRRYASECLAVGSYHLNTRAIPLKGGGLRVGAVGEVVYTTLNYDRYWLSLTAALCSFGRFAGIGAATSMGLGQCAVLEPRLNSQASEGGES